ncbi:MAG: type III pantothenate kinase [Candidatus Omnitrophota bacterium]
MKHKLIIIAIDIGNTSIHLGLFKANKLISQIRIPTKISRSRLKENIAHFGLSIKRRHFRTSSAIICSVVPHMNYPLAKLLKKTFDIKVLILGKDLIVPIKNLYKKPKSVGEDRLINAFAGKTIYGKPLIIIDMGTAITFDIVSKKGEYLGGIIAPGLNLSLDALDKGTALLPKLQLPKANKKFKLIGTETCESIYSGVMIGSSLMIKGLIRELKHILGKDTKVILTGGDAKLMIPFLKKSVDFIDQTLTLRGIALLAQILLDKI